MKTGRQQFLDRAEARGRIQKRAERRLVILIHLQSPRRHDLTADSDPSLEQLEETHSQFHEDGHDHDQGDLSA